MPRQTLLTASDLTIGYAGRSPHVVARALDLEMRSGELVCLIGPNGVGKSTLMRTLAGMQSPLAGSVRLNDRDLHAMEPARLARTLAVVLTDRLDIELMRARALVEMGRLPHTGWSGALDAEDHRVVDEVMETANVVHLADRELSQLSDGERQRVMIARALAQQPSLLVLDEVTAFLDLPGRIEVMNLLLRLAHRDDRTLLLSTHDLDLALRHADRLWLLAPGGKLRTGPPEALALRGAFDEVFGERGPKFDRRSGIFAVDRAAGPRVVVEGEGLPAVWVERALVRLGYECVAEEDGAAAGDGPAGHEGTRGSRAAKIVVSGNSDSAHYRLEHPTGDRDVHSLSDLIEVLETLDPAASQG